MLVRVVHSNSVVEWKVTQGVSVQLPELSLAVASADPRRRRAHGTVGVRVRCSGPSKKCSARVPRDARGEKERTGSCAGIGVASGQVRLVGQKVQ